MMTLSCKKADEIISLTHAPLPAECEMLAHVIERIDKDYARQLTRKSQPFKLLKRIFLTNWDNNGYVVTPIEMVLKQVSVTRLTNFYSFLPAIYIFHMVYQFLTVF